MNEEQKKENIAEKLAMQYLGDNSKKKILKKESKVKKLLSKSAESIADFVVDHKKVVGTGVALTAAGLSALGFFTWDYYTKRQDYPIRKVLYQVHESVSFSGGERIRDARAIDYKSVSIVQVGSEDGTKLGDLIAIHKLDATDEIKHYQLENEEKTRIAYASEKREKVQSGMAWMGTIDFREQNAELIGEKGKFITYSFIPERGVKNLQLNTLTDAKGNRTLVNELITYRSIPLGVIFGDKFRNKTELVEFKDTKNNEGLKKVLFESIDNYDKTPNLSEKQREKLVKGMMEMIQKMDVTSVYSSFEDGLFDWLPQESSTYLFSIPGDRQRTRAFFKGGNTQVMDAKPIYPDLDHLKDFCKQDINNPNNDVLRIRVENHWDIWPGNYWLLNQLNFGKNENTLRPFGKRNNGGYTIRDDHGDIAKVTITDFIFHYGDDTLYQYYLDKDGNGKIDETKELIGQVLYRTSWDEQEDLEGKIGEGHDKKDVSRNYTYSFMAGNDWENRYQEFYLCNTIESFMVNEVARGFGKHSDIGWINQERSNILLRENKTVPNLGRALTAESTIVAKNDMIALLRAAGRGEYLQNYIKEECQVDTETKK